VTAPHAAGALRRLSPGLALLIFVALMLAVPKPARPLAPAPVLSGIERAGAVSLARDCGYSAPLPGSPGRSLWLFCDTPVYARTAGGWALRRFIAGSTAAAGPVGPGGVPGALTEVGTPGAPGARGARGARGAQGRAGAPGSPAPFLAAPAGLVTPAGLPCGSDGSYAASWASGVARVPSTPELLVTFNNYCVLAASRSARVGQAAARPLGVSRSARVGQAAARPLGGSGGFLYEGFGVAEYDPATGTLTGDVTVFAGPDDGAPMLLGSPVFSGRYLYLYGPACAARRAGRCAGTVFEARVPATAAAWTDPLSYRWRTGGGSASWTADAALAGPVIAGPSPAGVSVGSYPAAGRRFVLIEQTSIDGAFTVYGSAAPDGTWKRIMSGRVPCRRAAGYANFCRAIIGHPELSTRGQIVLSYFDPAAGPHGHVMVAGFRW